MKTILTAAAALLIAAPAPAQEPVQLTDQDLDGITAGALTSIIVFTPNQPPQQVGCDCLNHFIEHGGVSTETYVIPGKGAAVHNPGGEHGSIPQPD